METRERRRIGSYRVVRHLGTGGMATVYEAVQEPEEKRAAVKVLHPSFAANKDIVSRFLSEGHASNLISHPGIVRIFDCGQLSDGTAYLAMEYLDGVSLHERLNQIGGRLPEEVALRIGRQLADALTALHDAKIVHRDLKPENVMLVPEGELPGGERAKILDFGIAKLAEEVKAPGAMPTRTGMLMGTPTYMAPEQCRGARGVDDRADVYALGVILYQMIAGQPPFTSPGAAEVMAMHVFETAQPLRSRAPHASPGLETLVHEMLSKPPGARPSMRIVAQRLGELAPRSASPDDHTLLTDARRSNRDLLDAATRHDGDDDPRGIAELAAELAGPTPAPSRSPSSPPGSLPAGAASNLADEMTAHKELPSALHRPGQPPRPPRQLPPGAPTELASPQSPSPRTSPDAARTEVAALSGSASPYKSEPGARTEVTASPHKSDPGARTEITPPSSAKRSDPAQTVLSSEIPQSRSARHAQTKLVTPAPTVFMGPDGQTPPVRSGTMELPRYLASPLILGLIGAVLASVVAIVVYMLLR
ncbi:MAG: protein kinase [Polyangia bacterium]